MTAADDTVGSPAIQPEPQSDPRSPGHSLLDRLAPHLNTVATVVSGLSIAVLVLVGAGVGLMIAGFRPVVILSGSMGETAPAGSVVVAGPVGADDIAAGDVLVMRRPEKTAVTHRVIEIETSDQFRFAITKGDANELPDAAPYPLEGNELVGRWVIPRIGGWWLSVFRPVPVLAVLGLTLLALAIAAIRRIWSAPRGPSPPDEDDCSGGSPPEEHTSARRGRPTRRGFRRRQLAGAALAVPVIIAFGAGSAWALFDGQGTVATNLFQTKACFDPQLTSIQQGETVHAIDGTVSVPITAVDPTDAFVVASLRSDSNQPADSVVQVDLSPGGTAVELVRSTDAVTPPSITVAWSVVEYGCGLSVQRGTVNGDGTGQLDVTIGAVDPAASFVLVSSAPEATAASYGADDLYIAELINATTLRIRADGSAFDTGRTFAWQVVSFDDPADAAVQTVTTSLSSAQASDTITLGSAVNVDSTFLLATATSTSTGADIGERLIRAHLVDANTVAVDRSLTGDSIDVSIQVVDLRDGSTVRHGTVDLSASQSSAAVTIAPVDTSRAVAVSTVAQPGVAAGGMTDHAADDVAGEGSATIAVTDPTTVTVTRDGTASNASFGWQVIEWAGPTWWDGDYQFRQRIDVTADSVAAPGGYTVPLTFDHAALVNTGLSLANGNDVRVIRWDGSAWTELDRILDDDSAWNQASTSLLFRTVDPIAADAADTYWLYYGHASAAAPPVDPEAVYLLHENFDAGNMGDFVDQSVGVGWYQALPWTRRIQLTVPSGAVGSDLTDYPLLVSLTSADLGTNAQADGSDIRFTASDGTTELAHEIETFDAGTGALTAWVQVPTVTAASATTIHLYYGAADSPDRQDQRTLWPSPVEAAWHLHRDPSASGPRLDDSSLANRDGLSDGSMATADLVAGAAGSAIDFDGVDDVLRASAFDPSPTGALTLSALVNLDAYTSSRIVTKADDATAGIFELSVTGTGALRGRLKLDGTVEELQAGTVPIGAWHHTAMTWDGTTMRLYLDGVEIASQAATGTLDADDAMPVTIGNTATADRPLDGTLDEVRVISAARSADWVAAVADNLLTPGSFHTVGTVESGSWLGQGTWSYRKPMVVDHSLVPADRTDYPLLVEFTDPLVGANAAVDGSDLVFTAADGTTRLDHALESFDSGTGAISAWIRMPTLSSVTNVRAFLYYGNAAADQQHDPVAVFGHEADITFSGAR